MNSFPQFNSPRMPFEIKTIIWEHFIALTPARNVPLKLRSRLYEPQGRDANLQLPAYYLYLEAPRIYAYYSPGPPPSALHVCALSRQLAMKRWTLSFSCVFITRNWNDVAQGTELFGEGATQGNESEGPQGKRRGTVWIDLQNDTLEFLSWDREESYETQREKEVAEDIITIPQFEECVELEERETVKRIRLQWKGMIYATHFEDRKSPRPFDDHEVFITACFPELEVLTISIFLSPGDTLVKWRAGLSTYAMLMLWRVERRVEIEGGMLEFEVRYE